MVKMFGVDVAAIIAKHAKVFDAILIKVTPGVRTPGNLSAGTNPTTVSHNCQGFVMRQNLRNLPETLADSPQLTVVLLGNTINGGATEPDLGDEITIEGTTYKIPDDGRIDRDPAKATFTCTVRTA